MQAISGPAQPTYTAVVPTADPINNPFVAKVGVERWNELSGGVPDTGLVCPITLIQSRLFELLLEVADASSLDWQNAVEITMHATLSHSLLLGTQGFYSVNGVWRPSSHHSNEAATKACKNLLRKLETAYRTLGYKPLIDWAVVLKKAMPGNDYALTHPVGYSFREGNGTLLKRVIASRAAIMKPYHHPFGPVIEEVFDFHLHCWNQALRQPERAPEQHERMRQALFTAYAALPPPNDLGERLAQDSVVGGPQSLFCQMARTLITAQPGGMGDKTGADFLADLRLYKDIAARLRDNLPDNKVAGKAMRKVHKELVNLLDHWDGFWPNIDWETQIYHSDEQVRHFHFVLLGHALRERIPWAKENTKACYTAIDEAYRGAPPHLKQRLNRLRLFVQQAELAFKIGREAIIGGSKDYLPSLGEVLGPTTAERTANMAALIAEEEDKAPKAKPKPAVEWNWTAASSSSSSEEEVAVEVPEVTPIPFGDLVDGLSKLKPSGEGAKQRSKLLRAVPEVIRLNLRRWEEIRDRTTLPAARQKMLIAHGLCEAALRAMVMHYLPDGLLLQHTHNLNLPIGALYEAVPSTRGLLNDHQGLLKRVGRAHGALNFGEGQVSLDAVDELVGASIEFVTATATLVQQGDPTVTPYHTNWVEEALATERAEGSAVQVDEEIIIAERPERIETADDAKALLPAAIESIPLLQSVPCQGDRTYRDRMLNVGAQSMEVVNAKLTSWQHGLPLSDIMEGLRQGERGLRAMLLARAEQAGFERIHAPSRPNTTRPLTHDGNLTHIFRQLMTYPELKPDSLPDLTTPWLSRAHHRLNHPTPPDGNSNLDRLINDILKLSADYDKLRPCAEDEKVGKLSWPKWRGQAEKIRARALPFLIQLVDATIQTTLNDWPI